MIAFIYRLARWAAIVGGIVLVALTIMIVVSIVGRSLIGLGLAPVPGDFELVEMGTAVAVLLFALEILARQVVGEGQPAGGVDVGRFEDRVDLVFGLQTLGDDFELQHANGTE